MDLDYALVGGGLQNGLIALAIRAVQPDARIAVVERGAALGGNHTWCFHAGDVPEAARAWIDPLVVARWTGHDVAFPAFRRQLDGEYACVSSERFAEVVTRALAVPGSGLLTRSTSLTHTRDHVVVRAHDGSVRMLRARVVIDARGPDRSPTGPGGWQKFVGQELRLTAPHGLERPMLMDATVPQRDGFRFMYVLPLSPDRLLVEDTYFSLGTHLDVADLRREIAAYCAAHGWTIAETLREETGLLPLPSRVRPPVVDAAAPLAAGYGGGWFHPVTGYSFPIAVRLASFVASRTPETLFADGELAALASAHARQAKFAARLNHMLFHWFAPADRHHVLEKFYRLPEDTIRRFYALELTARDRARILVGRPPQGMSLRAALGLEAS